MKFSLATIYVKDMDRSIKFYTELLEIPLLGRRSMGPHGEMAFLGEEGNVNLELISTGQKVEYKGFSIGFQTENMDKAIKMLSENGYEIEKELNPAPSIRLCFFKGPDGEEIELLGK